MRVNKRKQLPIRRETCLFICVHPLVDPLWSGWVGGGGDQRGTSAPSRLETLVPHHPALLLEAAGETDRKEMGKSQNSNCHPAKASGPERHQIDEDISISITAIFPPAKPAAAKISAFCY